MLFSNITFWSFLFSNAFLQIAVITLIWPHSKKKSNTLGFLEENHYTNWSTRIDVLINKDLEIMFLTSKSRARNF
jgi:hypothetical protein